MIEVVEMVKNPKEAVGESRKGFSEGLKLSAFSGLVLTPIYTFHLSLLSLVGLIQFYLLIIPCVVLGLIGPAISAAVVHPFVYFFGGRKYEKTYKCFAFLTPLSILGSVPVINILALPALLILQIRAVKEVQELNWYHSLISVLLPGIILTIIGLATLLGIETYTEFSIINFIRLVK